ncbi:MAG: trigger factor, partial [Synergistaceae bacterium]|nr:trigger factor [Synergistaceae bacterium]
EHLASDALENVVSEYDLDLVTDPKVKPGDLSEGNPIEIEFTFEVRPEVELPDISSLTAEKIVYEVRDEDVEEGLRQLLEANARLEPLEDDRPATRDDIIEVQYSSYTAQGDGSMKELERDKKNTLFLANLREDISNAVIGHKPAEELSFDITLEDDYPDSRMAGKTVRYNMEILNFMKRVVPEPTDETILELSKGKYNSVGEIRAEMRRQLEANASERSEGTLQESAIKALSAAAVVTVPESMIDRQYMAMRREQDGMIRQDLKQSLDDYLKNNNLSVEDFDGGLKKRAETIVRNALVLDILAERDEISFTSDDLNDEILRTANAMRVNPQEYADALSGNKQEFAALAGRVRTKNTVKHLASLVQVTEKKEDYSAAHDHDHDDDGHHHEHDHDHAGEDENGTDERGVTI